MSEPTLSRPVSIEIDGAHTVSALLQGPRDASACLVAAHGAGAGMEPGFNWSSQHLSALIAAPHQGLRRAFSNRASCAASR